MIALIHPEARLIDGPSNVALAGSSLVRRAEKVARSMGSVAPGAIFLGMPTSVLSIVRFMGALHAGRPVALIDPKLALGTLAAHVARYQPAAVMGFDDAEPWPDGLAGYDRVDEDAPVGPTWIRRDSSPAVDPDLAVLLATSGSTGDPRFVRLSRSAIAANARSIGDVLEIGPDAVTVTTLPLFYSFGMSVVTTYMLAGGAIVVSSDGLVTRDFWETVVRHDVTSLALVPSQYEMLHRLRFDPKRYPSLRVLTQAGGRLRPELVVDFHARMSSVGGRLYVMYGQTEGGPRLTILPPDRLPAKLGSVGPAVPGGSLSILDDGGREHTTPGLTGEVVYRGPNVMMGYASTAADVGLGDTQGGVLRTGDEGHLDEDGFLYITGRRKRVGKVFGVRLNLDDLERMVRWDGPVAAVAGDDHVVVWVEGDGSRDIEPHRHALADGLRLHHSGFRFQQVDALPLLDNGKVNYRAIEGAE